MALEDERFGFFDVCMSSTCPIQQSEVSKLFRRITVADNSLRPDHRLRIGHYLIKIIEMFIDTERFEPEAF